MSIEEKLSAQQIQIVAPISIEKISSRLASNDKDWEWLDYEMIKLGSLNHSQLDKEKAISVALELLENKTKDFRVLAHLLRLLQHAINPNDIYLSLVLLDSYVIHYWNTAYPQGEGSKTKFLEPVLKRYMSIWPKLEKNIQSDMCEKIIEISQKLDQYFTDIDEVKIAKYFHKMSQLPRELVINEPNEIKPSIASIKQESHFEKTEINKKDIPPLNNASDELKRFDCSLIGLDINDSKQFKQSQFLLANILATSFVSNPIGYRLRRHALWFTISSLPLANESGRTPLSALPIDLIDTYTNRLENPDITVWGELEKSIELAPFWFDGHRLSALYAEKLGFISVSQSIKQELTEFINRLPGIDNLQFSDGTPFIATLTKQWLYNTKLEEQVSNRNSELHLSGNDELEYKDTDSWLELLEQNSHDNIKSMFFQQLKIAQQFEKMKLAKLATQQYSTLLNQLMNTDLTVWEVDLVIFLKNKLAET